jgi:hypothetical protein
MTRAEIHHTNVGQGDSTLIVTPSDETVLVDTGENPSQRRPGEDPNEIDIETAADVDRLFGTHDSFMTGESLESLDHRSALAALVAHSTTLLYDTGHAVGPSRTP